MPPPRHEAPPAPFGLDRIVFFSDAVMAIAITLLVLDLRIPEAAGEEALDLGRTIGALWPKYLGYFVSFWVIALYWVAHHRCFRFIRSFDRRLIYLNFLFLMCLAFLPHPTAVLFSHPVRSASVALYAGAAAGMGFSLAGVWIYAGRHRFLSRELDLRQERDIRLNFLLPPLVFLLSAIVAPLNANLAMYLWLLQIPIYALRRYTETRLMGREEL
jgi:uncharacterized membrane protein